MNIELSCVGRWPVKVPGVAKLTVHPGFPIVVHVNCVDMAKAEKLTDLKIVRLVAAPVVEELPAVVAAPEPPPVAEVVDFDKLLREAELPCEAEAAYTEPTVTPRKRGRPSKKLEE